MWELYSVLTEGLEDVEQAATQNSEELMEEALEQLSLRLEAVKLAVGNL